MSASVRGKFVDAGGRSDPDPNSVLAASPGVQALGPELGCGFALEDKPRSCEIEEERISVLEGTLVLKLPAKLAGARELGGSAICDQPLLLGGL